MKHDVIPVLSIAGSDCSGGAGVQADLKTMSALGCYAMSVVTAITAQNTLGVSASAAVAPELVGAQIDAVMSDIRPLAVKVGMLHSRPVVAVTAERLARHGAGHVVVDPVMLSTSGSRLLDPEAVAELTGRLFPLAELVTPNVAEAVALTATESAERQAEMILGMGPGAVLLKGGDRVGRVKTDLLFMADGSMHRYEAESVDTVNTHGTGCTLSSAIAVGLAKGLPVADAVGMAKEYVTGALRAGASLKIGAGHGPVNHFFMYG